MNTTKSEHEFAEDEIYDSGFVESPQLNAGRYKYSAVPAGHISMSQTAATVCNRRTHERN